MEADEGRLEKRMVPSPRLQVMLTKWRGPHNGLYGLEFSAEVKAITLSCSTIDDGRIELSLCYIGLVSNTHSNVIPSDKSWFEAIRFDSLECVE